jgi:microsomal epoxide hydrolase
MAKIEPFHFEVSDKKLKDIRQRVAEYLWHEMPDDGGWDYGTNLDYMKVFCDYWLNHYDWRKHEAKINHFSHFKVRVDGIDLHYIHEKGSGSSPQPLIISHGWPGSIVEFLDIIEPLAHPERFGGNADDGFDVIAPSLPGFGFSGRPARPMGPRKMAHVFNSLMTDILGYDGYIAQGGDWGGAISSWLGFEHAACYAIHINILTMRHPHGPQSAEEQAWADKFDQDQIMEDGYRTQQATRPQTLSYAMMDSPVGLAAWFIEKFNSWSDTIDNDIDRVHSKDSMLTNVMVYLATGTFNTASWIYYGRREEGGRYMSLEDRRVEVPTALALFPAEMLAWPPRSYAERLYNVQQWTEMAHGGHFAAMEQPALLIEDIRTFGRKLR